MSIQYNQPTHRACAELTDDIRADIDRIMGMIRDGMTQTAAIRAANHSQEWWHRWKAEYDKEKTGGVGVDVSCRYDEQYATILIDGVPAPELVYAGIRSGRIRRGNPIGNVAEAARYVAEDLKLDLAEATEILWRRVADQHNTSIKRVMEMAGGGA